MRNRKWLLAAAPFIVALFIFMGGEVVKLLWNWLMPSLFRLPVITFWQAFGLLALARILFGGSGIGGRGMGGTRYRRRMAENWEKMTPEQREKYGRTCYGRWMREASEEVKPTL